MQILKQTVDLDHFFDQLKTTAYAVLFLDYDGTLAPFQIDPLKALPYPGVIERLKIINEKGQTKLVIVSGRSLHDLIPLIGMDPLPELWGSHGGERLIGQNYNCFTLSTNQQQILNNFEQFLKDKNIHSYEKKPLGIAVHFRSMDLVSKNKLKEDLLAVLEPITQIENFEIHYFEKGLEFRLKGLNKSYAVATVLNELTVTLPVPIAYLGDDATDEDAFAFIGENGLKILVRKELRKTCADILIIPPEELLDFFDRWVDSQK